jgi:hypothetical protein
MVNIWAIFTIVVCVLSAIIVLCLYLRAMKKGREREAQGIPAHGWTTRARTKTWTRPIRHPNVGERSPSLLGPNKDPRPVPELPPLPAAVLPHGTDVEPRGDVREALSENGSK